MSTESSKTRVEKVCEYCGTIFHINRYRHEQGKGRFCSKWCYKNGYVQTEDTKRLNSRQISTQNRCPVCRRYSEENRCNFCSTHDLTKIKKICKTCGKAFSINKSEITKRPNRGQYCSQKCRKLGKYMKCLQCGKLFFAHLCETRQGRKYCNSKCYGKAKQTRVKTNCQKCGKEIDTTSYYMQRGWKKFCSPECQYKGQKKGEYRTCKTCNMSFHVTRWEAENGKGVFCSPKCYDRGLTTLNDKIRANTKYRQWYATVLKRDNYRCQNPNCRLDKSHNGVQVHHIKRLSDIINEHGITTIVQAIECEAIWDYDNAITLCVSCHAEVDKSILNMSSQFHKKRRVATKTKIQNQTIKQASKTAGDSTMMMSIQD